MTSRRWSSRVGPAVASIVLMTSACGSSSAPSDAVPELGEALGRVDEAIVAGRYDEARTELDELVATTTEARADGDVGASEVDRILAAAAQVMSALPAEPADEPEPEPSPTSDGSADDSEEPEDSQGSDDSEREAEKLEKEQEKLEDKLEREQEKENRGKGTGKGND